MSSGVLRALCGRGAADKYSNASGDDRGIVDQSALRMREATFVAGVWLTYVVCGSSAVYIACTWSRPHRILIALLFGAGLLGGAIVSMLPRQRIVRSRFREAFFLGWSILDLLLISLADARRRRHGQPAGADLLLPGRVRRAVLPARLGGDRRRASRSPPT